VLIVTVAVAIEPTAQVPREAWMIAQVEDAYVAAVNTALDGKLVEEVVKVDNGLPQRQTSSV
jgi:hypothetical protein